MTWFLLQKMQGIILIKELRFLFPNIKNIPFNIIFFNPHIKSLALFMDNFKKKLNYY